MPAYCRKWHVKIFLSAVERIFPDQPCPIVPRHLLKAEKSSRRSQTDRTKGNSNLDSWVLQNNNKYGNIKIVIPKWNIAEITGYDPMTTFWQDFSMADKFGNEAIADTYRKVKAEWKDNYKHWTELCLVLNHKIWQWHERDNQKATLYDRRMARRAAGVLLSNNGLKQSAGRCEVSPL